MQRMKRAGLVAVLFSAALLVPPLFVGEAAHAAGNAACPASAAGEGTMQGPYDRILLAVVKPPPGYRIKQKAKEADADQISEPAEAEEPPVPNISIEVNISATELTLYEDGKPLFVKPVAIGQGVYPTPEQESHITRIEWNPWWYPPPAEWAKDDKPTPPGPGNPLGLVKMPLSDAILFHGTNKESSVGRAASHGCMRMRNADAVELAWYLQERFSKENDPGLLDTYKKKRRKTFKVMLETPVPVRLIYQPIVRKGGMLVFYPDYYKRLAKKGRREQVIMEKLQESGMAPEEIDEAKVAKLARQKLLRGTEVPIASLGKEALPEEAELKKEKKSKERKPPARRRGRYSRYREN